MRACVEGGIDGPRTDTGDEFTKTQLEQKKEKTLALIKPDAFLKMGDDFIALVQPHVCMLCARRLCAVRVHQNRVGTSLCTLSHMCVQVKSCRARPRQ